MCLRNLSLLGSYSVLQQITLLKNFNDRRTDVLDQFRIHLVQLFISSSGQGHASGKLEHVMFCPQHLVYIFDVSENICISL